MEIGADATLSGTQVYIEVSKRSEGKETDKGQSQLDFVCHVQICTWPFSFVFGKQPLWKEFL